MQDTIAVASLPLAEKPSAQNRLLSEDEINALLQEAETRLREAQNNRSRQKNDPVSKYSKLPKLKSDSVASPYLQEQNGVAQVDPAILVDTEQRRLADSIFVPELKAKKDPKKAKENAGSDWFDLPRTDLTPKLKRDLRLLEMRNVLDPHRHYKNQGRAKIPTFSQVGTVIEGPTEYYSARLNKRDRKQTFVDEVIAGEQANGRFKRKYNEIQEAKTSGKKAHYNKLKEQRKRRT